MPALAWQVLTLGVVGACLVLIALRILAIARKPVHLRWELAPVPYARGKGGTGGSYLEEYEWWTKPRRRSTARALVYTASEIFLQRSIWRHNRGLWPLTFVFHIGLYLTAVLSLGVAPVAVLSALGLDLAAVTPLHEILSALALLAYVLGGVGAAGLLLKRVFDPDLRRFNTISRYVNLLFLGVVFLSGVCAWVRSEDYAAEVSRFARSVITLDPNATLGPSFSIHLVISLLFLLYFPLTDMIHFIAKYFTYHAVRWDDRPRNGTMEKELRGLLAQPVTWSAPHIGSGGRRDWADVAGMEARDESTS